MCLKRWRRRGVVSLGSALMWLGKKWGAGISLSFVPTRDLAALVPCKPIPVFGLKGLRITARFALFLYLIGARLISGGSRDLQA